MKQFKTILCLLTFIGFMTTSALADNNIKIKLERGVVNLITAPLEIPKQAILHSQEAPTLTKKTIYLIPGFMKGVLFALGRFGSGLWDVVTCNIEKPANYNALMKPDYVWQKEE